MTLLHQTATNSVVTTNLEEIADYVAAHFTPTSQNDVWVTLIICLTVILSVLAIIFCATYCIRQISLAKSEDQTLRQELEEVKSEISTLKAAIQKSNEENARLQLLIEKQPTQSQK